MDKSAFEEYILKFACEVTAVENSDLADRQLQALFTAYCLMFDVNPDTAECDTLLSEIFGRMLFLVDTMDMSVEDIHNWQERFNDSMLSDLV